MALTDENKFHDDQILNEIYYELKEKDDYVEQEKILNLIHLKRTRELKKILKRHCVKTKVFEKEFIPLMKEILNYYSEMN